MMNQQQQPQMIPQLIRVPVPMGAPVPVPIGMRPSMGGIVNTMMAAQRFRAPLAVAIQRPMVQPIAVRAMAPMQMQMQQDSYQSDKVRFFSGATRKSTSKSVAPDAAYIKTDEVIVEKVNQYECCGCCCGNQGRCPLWVLVLLSIVVFLVILGIILVVVFTLVKF